MNFLFLTNPGVDMGRPDFRIGTFKTYLFALRDRVVSDVDGANCRFLVGEHALNIMARDPDFISRGFDEFVSFPTMTVFEDRAFGDSAVSDIYNEALTEEEEARLRQAYIDTLDGFKPDTIVSWEFPTATLRALFPDAMVIDLMPGAFMRPPYNKTVAFDPSGIYRHSALQVLLNGEVQPTLEEVLAWRQLSDEFAGFFSSIDARKHVLEAVTPSRDFDKYVLLPLQVESYFGYRDNCKFTSQYDLLQAVMRQSDPSTGVIVTQYISNLFADQVLNKDNAEALQLAYPNFLYSPILNNLDNISQFIAPWADETISVSSTVALQAHFFGRKVSSPSTSHLPYVASSADLLGAEKSAALAMSRYSLPWTKMIETPCYFVDLVEHFRTYKEAGLLEAYRNWPLAPDTQVYFNEANFRRAHEMFALATGTTPQVSNARIKGMLDTIRSADVVSFDIFDTLLQRKVFHPADVFLLTPQEKHVSLNKEGTRHLSPAIYSSLRQAAERTLRIERDAVWESNPEFAEEITTEEIFKRLTATLNLNDAADADQMAGDLLILEQEVEATVLEATKLGAMLFNYARSLGKKIVIISDFCHDSDFVDRQLKEAGYHGYTLFVSSGQRHKKHSGNLYTHVEKVENLKDKRVVHVGDNPHGDIEKAKKHGWHPIRINLPKVQFQKRMVERGVDFTSFADSLSYRTTVNLFANRFVNNDLTSHLTNRAPYLVKTRNELGYLTLGPLVTAFARWIKEQAKEAGATQVLLFARDCILPYQALRLMESQGLLEGLSCFYVPASRMATKALDLLHPLDVFQVNIADFSRTATVGELLWQRFMLQPDLIEADIWRETGVLNESRHIRHVSIAAIYQLVYLHVSRNWDQVSAAVQNRRASYASLLEGLGIDLSQHSALVDIGYKGTITRIVSTFFDKPVLPLFMTTYPDEIGDDPINNCRTFLSPRMAKTKNDTFRRFNLVIETLLNEATGSVALVDDTIKGDMDVFREASPSEAHLATISRVHNGALQFTEDWYATFGNFLKEPRFETNKLLELLDCILSAPTVEEAVLLADLEFDNNFSGHKPRLLVSGDHDPESSVWKEGAVALSHPVMPIAQRHQLISEGAFCSYKYDEPIAIMDTFTGKALFGAGGRGKTRIQGIPIPYNWIHEEVSSFEITSNVLQVQPMELGFVQDSHFNQSQFKIWQNGTKLDYKIYKSSARHFSLRFDARPAFPIVVQNPGYRKSSKPEKDARRFYWRFLSLNVVNEN